MWKVAIIRPVAMVGTFSDPSDFRPISILSVLSKSKAFERILHDKVLEHVNGSNMLSDFQSGFRRGYSTVTALVRVTEDLRSAKAEEKITVYVLLDLSKVFDPINHGLFAMGMILSFLRDRSMVVEVDGVKSTPRFLSSFHRDISHRHCFFLCLSMICVLIFVFQSFISMLMICRFICLRIGRIWMR
jgi:hypothetical protein